MIDPYVQELLAGRLSPEQWAHQLGDAVPSELRDGYSIAPRDPQWIEMFLAIDADTHSVEYLRMVTAHPDKYLWQELRSLYGSSRELPTQIRGTHEVMFKVDRRDYPAIARIVVTIDRPPDAPEVCVLGALLRRDPRS